MTVELDVPERIKTEAIERAAANDDLDRVHAYVLDYFTFEYEFDIGVERDDFLRCPVS